MQVFRSIQDEDLVRNIGAARTRLVYVAPGISASVGEALQARLKAGNCAQLMIVLDADEECCRLGYCVASALKELDYTARQSGIPIWRRAGLRLGLLMADEQVLIWTPTPLMFEAPRAAEEPNGLLLSPHTLSALPGALGIDPQKPAGEDAIGASVLGEDEVAKVVQAIKTTPPAPFDLSRLARVFSARFQFIETVLRGAELTTREMRLDSLIVNSDAPKELQPLLHTTIQPFQADADRAVEVPVLVNGEPAYRKNGDPMTRPTTQADIRAYWADLNNRFIVSLPGFGKIIRQDDKIKFEEGKAAFVAVLEQWVKGFREQVQGDHDQRVKRVVDLISQRMGHAAEGPRLTRSSIETLVNKGLERLRVIEPSVKTVYKNITVESTRDEEFLEVLRSAVPAPELEGWFKTFDAAPMVQTIKQQ
jgi:hypothetical protein